MESEPRTHLDMMRDLFGHAQAREWVGAHESCSRGCCEKWHVRCSDCGADEGDYKKPESYRKHKEGCKLAPLILEVETYLEVEQTLAEEREAAAELAEIEREIAEEAARVG